MFQRPKLLIAGLLIIAFGVAILVANRPERAQNVADELVEATTVLPENEGKLVIVSGTPWLADGGVITDEEAGLRVENAVYYSRVPLQKVYVLKKRKVVIDKGEDLMSEVDDVTEIEYYVVKDWIGANQARDEVIKVNGYPYENPMPVKLSPYHVAADMRVGDFRVSPADLFDHYETKERWFTREQLEEACGQYITRSELNLRAVADQDGDGLLSTGDEIGDVHVHIWYDTLESAEPVTIVGRQRGDEIVFEEDDLVSEAEQVRAGTISREEFLDAITSEDASSMKYGIGALVVGAVLVLLSLKLGG